jgi:hypothetical protein
MSRVFAVHPLMIGGLRTHPAIMHSFCRQLAGLSGTTADYAVRLNVAVHEYEVFIGMDVSEIECASAS